jgi:hypothetical protein
MVQLLQLKQQSARLFCTLAHGAPRCRPCKMYVAASTQKCVPWLRWKPTIWTPNAWQALLCKVLLLGQTCTHNSNLTQTSLECIETEIRTNGQNCHKFLLNTSKHASSWGSIPNFPNLKVDFKSCGNLTCEQFTNPYDAVTLCNTHGVCTLLHGLKSVAR